MQKGAITMRRRYGIAVLAAASLALTACGALDEEDSAPPPGEGDEGATTVRVGHLQTIAVDDKLQLGLAEGYFAAEGLDLEVTQFDTGVAASQALSGGSIDVALMGAVSTNFAAQGQGTIFLANAIENATAQIWAQPDAGISSIEDLRGKSVITTEGTTADIFLMHALESEGIDRSALDISNADMSSSVQAFASGSVDAIVLWVPFDLRVQEAVPDAVLVDTAADYPEAAVMSSWMANNTWYSENEDIVDSLVSGWMQSNAALQSDPDGSLATIQEFGYENQAPLEELEHQIEFQTNYSNEEWLEHYESGHVLELFGNVQESFVELGAANDYVDPEEFVDTEPFIRVGQEAF